MKQEYYIYDHDLAIGDTDKISFRQTAPKGRKDGIHLLHLCCKVDWPTKSVSIKPMLGVDGEDELFTPDTEFEDCLPPENLHVLLRGLAIDVCYVLSPGQGTVEEEFNRAISDFLSEKASLEIVREAHDKPMIAFYLKIDGFTSRALFDPKDLEKWLAIKLTPFERLTEKKMKEIEERIRSQGQG